MASRSKRGRDEVEKEKEAGAATLLFVGGDRSQVSLFVVHFVW